MAFKAFMSPISGWIAEWQYWRGENVAASPGEFLRRVDVLVTEVAEWQAELAQGKWVDPNYIKEMAKVAQYCLADAGHKFEAELAEVASLDFSEPEGFARFFKTPRGDDRTPPEPTHWAPPDDPEYRRMQAEFDAKLAGAAKRFERILRTARAKMLGLAPDPTPKRAAESTVEQKQLGSKKRSGAKGFEGLPQTDESAFPYLTQVKLTERQRDCVLLRFHHRLGITEIARRLDIDRATVYEHLGKAKAKFRMLSPDGRTALKDQAVTDTGDET